VTFSRQVLVVNTKAMTTARNEKLVGDTAIVLLNWNSGEMTAECIRSLFQMDADHFEVIVVDNGSKDGSAEYLRAQFPEITILPQDRNLGFAAGCNVGMKLAMERGFKYVLPLNNDTVVDPAFLAELLRGADERPQAAMISPKIYFWDMPDRFWWAGGSFSLWTGIAKHIGRKELDHGQFDQGAELDWATGCALLIRSDALRETGLFDESFFGNGEDLDLSLRLREAGYKIWFAPKAKLWHKEGVDYRKNAGEYLRKFTGTRNLLHVMRKHARAIQWFSFLPNFLLRYVGFYIGLSLARGDYRSAWAVLRGIAAFLRTRAYTGAGITNFQSGFGTLAATSAPRAEQRIRDSAKDC
jgi:GT2 family glycosyltransferase